MITKKLTKTQEVIKSQMLENTGIHMLDSGGRDGRGWQRNQKTGIDFNAPMDLERWLIPLQVYMETMLEHNEKCEQLEKELCSECDGYLGYSNQEEVHKALKARGYTLTPWIYTYNFDNDLSQDIQYLGFYENDEYNLYILLQVHNGCDARGGLTDGRIYKVIDRDYFILGDRLEAEDPNAKGGNPIESYEANTNSEWNEKDQRRYWNEDFVKGSKKVEVNYYALAEGF